MINTPHTNIQGAFRALSDPTRRQILVLLSEQDMSINQVVDQFNITRAAVKKHLIILEQGELISVHPKGRERINKLEPLALKSVTDWLNYFNQFWDSHLNKLQQAISNEKRDNNE